MRDSLGQKEQAVKVEACAGKDSQLRTADERLTRRQQQSSCPKRTDESQPCHGEEDTFCRRGSEIEKRKFSHREAK
jgi:hypothetical protein